MPGDFFLRLQAVFEIGMFSWPPKAWLRLICKENSKEAKLSSWYW